VLIIDNMRKWLTFPHLNIIYVKETVVGSLKIIFFYVLRFFFFVLGLPHLFMINLNGDFLCVILPGILYLTGLFERLIKIYGEKYLIQCLAHSHYSICTSLTIICENKIFTIPLSFQMFISGPSGKNRCNR
jgi:hypothetical protein